MGAVLLLAAAVAVGVTGALVAATLRVRGVAGFSLAVWTLASCEIVALLLLLSIPQWVSRATFGAAIAAMLGVAAGAWVAAGRPPFGGAGTALQTLRAVLRDPVVAVLAAVAAVSYAYLFVLGAATPEVDWDTLFYHLPRAALWAQEGAIGYIADAPDVRLNGMPPHAEIGVLATMLLAGNDSYVWLVQFVAAPATGLAVAGIARRLGAPAQAAAFGGLAFVLFPVVLLQAPTAMNDVAVVAPLAAATYFALGTTRAELALAALALALAVGTKFTAVLVLPLLVLVLFVFHRPVRWPSLVLGGVIGVALGSYWYALNLRETGSIDGGVAEAFAQIPDRSAGPTIERAGKLAIDFLDISGVQGRDRFLLPAAGAVIALAALAAARRQRLRRATALAAAGAAAATTPWLLEGLRSFVERAYFKAALIVDRPWLTGNLGGDELGTSANAQLSWYGPGFLALAVASAPLVLRAARSGVLAAAAVPALAAPFLFVPVLAYAVIHDPIRGRLFAFPVALAAATFGVALRVRAVAWAAAALLTLPATLSLVHYDTRPLGVSLLEPVRIPSLWRAERWEAQAQSAHVEQDAPVAFRFFEERLPARATIAVAGIQGTAIYPIFDPQGRRTILFDHDGAVAGEAEWLIVSPGRRAVGCASWQSLLRTTHGWHVLRRSGNAPCRVADE